MTPRKKIKHVLVTGFPTFTATKLVQAMAEREKSTRVHLLVMEKYLDFARQLMDMLSKPAQKRVYLHKGDVTYIDLGLSGAEFNELTSKVSHILHLAAIWDLGAPEKLNFEVNINGTRNLLEFAGECSNLERLGYYSTINVSGDRTGVIEEDEFWKGQKFKNDLESSRFAGERLIYKAIDRGFNATVFRLGNVIGDSASGEIMKFEGIFHFVKLLLISDKNLPVFLPGHCESPSNLAPVDYVVDASLHILSKEKSNGRTYHLTDPYPLAVKSVLESVSAYLGRKPPTFGIPRKLYRAVSLVPGMERFAGAPKDLFAYLNHKAVHNCSETLEILKGSGIACPRFESYLPIAIEYARAFLKERAERIEEARTVDPFDGYAP